MKENSTAGMEVGHKNSAGHSITTRWEFQKKGRSRAAMVFSKAFSEAHEEGPRAFCSLYTMCEMVSLLVVVAVAKGRSSQRGDWRAKQRKEIPKWSLFVPKPSFFCFKTKGQRTS